MQSNFKTLDVESRIFFEKLVFGTLFECPGILDIVSRTRTGATAELIQFCTVDPGDWQACVGGPRNMRIFIIIDPKTDQKPRDMTRGPPLAVTV